MCILCVIQKWSRRVATMLPWLVIPMIGLWALSQLLPPAFRFEITSTRLACVSVLLITLFWYEFLMPQLSSWRIRRNAQIREKKRFEAIEMQKLRKTATRRCRNCLTPYRDQTPCGGKFMCSYCGHVSKRPVLDLPVPPGLSSSRIWKDWLENGSCGSVPFGGKASICPKNGSECYSNGEKCATEKSYSLLPKIFSYSLNDIGMVWKMITRDGSNGDDALLDAERRKLLAKPGDNAGSFNESRVEKARRKAEEKRQARIERELLEEEERKQREEVARLVEERRKLRDEILDAEKDSCRSVSASKEKVRRKEAEKKRQERRKEKDKGSSRSNSDVEELERKPGKESDRKKEFDKRSESDRRENSKISTDTAKSHNIDMAHGHKSVGSNNYSRGSAGTRYLDRMKGTFLSSSKALGNGSLFGRGSNTSASVSRENKPNVSLDPLHHSGNTRHVSIPVKASMNGETKSNNHPVFEPHAPTAPKKTWGQLFTRSPATTPVTNSNVIGRPCGKSQEVRSPPFMGHSSSGQLYDNPINFGLPSPFSVPAYSYAPTSSCTVPPLTSDAMFFRIGEVQRDHLPEEYEIFEDPCYVPDPVSLLGPVSESLDDFQLDLGPGFATDIGFEKPVGLKKISAAEVSRPSPIESPISRSRLLEEKHSNLNRLPAVSKARDVQKSPSDNSYDANQNGAWQMWNTSPLGQDGLGLVGAGPASWMLPPELNRLHKDEPALPTAQNTAASLFSTDNQVFSRALSPQKVVFPGSGQNVGNFASPVSSSTGDPWLPHTLYAQMPLNDGRFSNNPLEDSSHVEMMYGSPISSATNHSFKFPHVNGWAKNDRVSSAESTGSSSSTKPHIGGLYSTPNVQSLWSYD